MFRALLCAALALGATGANAGTPTEADIAAVEQFLATDNSYSPAAKAEAQRRAAGLSAYLEDQPRFELEVARIAALADNGHTALAPPQWTLRYPRSPVRLGLFADGLFVIAAPANYASAIGKRVTAINGLPWREAREVFALYRGGAPGFRDQFLVHFLETPALLSAAGIGDDAARLRLTLAGGPTLSVEPVMAPLQGWTALEGVPMVREAVDRIKGPLPLYLQDAEKAHVFVPLRELDAVYIRLNWIGGEELKALLDQWLVHLRSGKQRNIILDLRFNMGGDLNRARDFAKELPELAHGGHVYVITSGRSFSAAISTTGYVKQAGGEKVRIVGDPIGDRLEFWAEGRLLELPGLGANILYATERHNYVTGCPEADCHWSIREHPIRIRSLQPDLPAPLRYSDFVAGRDPAIEAIARDIGRRR